MGLKQTNVNQDDDKDFEDDTPVVSTGYYWGQLKSVNFYEKQGDQKIALQFEIETEIDGEQFSLTVPYFAFAKVSCYGQKDVDFASSSNLGQILEDLGGAEVFDEYVGADGGIVAGEQMFEVETGDADDQETFLGGLKAAMSGKRYKLNVKKTEETDSDGNVKRDDEGNKKYSNIVAEIEEVESVSDSSSGDTEEDSGDEEKEVLFDDDEEEEETDKDGEEV